MKNKCLVISAFPGIGKTFLYQENTVNYGDSDSSKFSKKNFPKNYIEHIKEAIKVKQVLFVSSHIKVREALVKAKIPFIYVLPTCDRKQEFLFNYEQRGSSKEFIKKVDRNWENWLMLSGYNKDYPVYFCKYGYLKDNMENIIKEYREFYERRDAML